MAGWIRYAVLAVVFGAGAVWADAGKGPLLVNGDFETGAADQTGPAEWAPTILPELAPYVQFRWDTEQVHGGTHSAAISIDEAHPDQAVSYNWTTLLHGWRPGTAYSIEGWVKTRHVNASAFICVQCWDASRTHILGFASTESACPVVGRSIWTSVKTTITVPPGTVEVRIRAGFSAPENRGGTVWFEDIKVMPVE